MIIAQDKRGTSAVLGKRPQKPTLPFSCFARPAQAGAAKQEKGGVHFWFRYPGRRCACPGLLSYHPYWISVWLALFEPIARHGQLAEDFLEILGIHQVANLVGQGVTNFLFEQRGCEALKREVLRTDNSLLGALRRCPHKAGRWVRPTQRSATGANRQRSSICL